MEQLWSHIYMCAKDKTMHWTQKPDQLDHKPLCNLLSTLHQSKIDWTDAFLWPEDYVEGQWKRVVPMSFLVANIGSGWTASSMVIDALCSGMLYPHPAMSLVQGKDQQCCKNPALVELRMMDHCVKEVQCLLSILDFPAALLPRAKHDSMRVCIQPASHEQAGHEEYRGAARGSCPAAPILCHCSSSTWHARVLDPCCVLAELRRLGNTAFVNTHDGSAPGCLEHAMSEGHVAAVEMMLSCGASPGKQGSTWAGFLRAATASFTPAKAALIHTLITQKPTFEVRLLQGNGWRRRCLLC